MPVDSTGAHSDNADLQRTVYGLYSALVAAPPFDPEAGLGGRLLFAGDLGFARPLLYAANIAGAASIAASSDPVAQRQAMRDGVVDFLVTSLDEALRILKNEIRKRQAVSVAIGLDPAEVVGKMLERGVLPDLLPASSWGEGKTGLSGLSTRPWHDQGAQQLADNETSDSEPAPGVYITWSVDRDAARWLPRIDSCVAEILPGNDKLRHRWLKLMPRYLGRAAQRQHGVALSVAEAAAMRDAVLTLLAGQDNQDNPPEVYLAGEAIR